MRNQTRGFTILELLVVAVIISLLASIALTFVRSGHERSRDGKRLKETREIRSALELYYTDRGNYPTDPNELEVIIDREDYVSLELTEANYFSVMPIDPLQKDPRVYTYTTDANGKGFTLRFCLEREDVCREIRSD